MSVTAKLNRKSVETAAEFTVIHLRGDPEPGAPVRCKRVVVGADRKVFASSKGPHDMQGVLNDKPKLKYIPEGKVRTQEMILKQVVQKKVIAKETNLAPLKTGLSNQELIRPIQKSPTASQIIKLAQKQKLVANVAQKSKVTQDAIAQKAKQEKAQAIQKPKLEDTDAIQNTKLQNNSMSIQNEKPINAAAANIKPAQETVVPQKIKPAQEAVAAQKTKLTQDAVVVQKNKLTQEAVAAQKTKLAQDAVAAQKNKLTQEAVTAQKTKLTQDAVAAQKNKLTQEAVAAQKTKLTQDVVAAQKTKLAQETVVVQKTQSAVPNKPTVETLEIDQETTASPAKSQTPVQSKTALPPEDQRELDPVLARAVEEELQDIMIQVWQELPDDPLEEEDRIAVDKLRHEAADDLRRVLGLNITKRLLNVFNNLFVKVQFTCRPQMGCLTGFLNEYHINKFKRIDKNSNTFAAQMETIEDFDRLCANKVLTCGEAKVSVTPCYKFTICPDNLKTIYDDTFFYEDTAQEAAESTKDDKPKAKVANKNCVEPEPAQKTEELKDDIHTKAEVANKHLVQAEATKKENNEDGKDEIRDANAVAKVAEKKNVEPEATNKAEESKDDTQKSKAKDGAPEAAKKPDNIEVKSKFNTDCTATEKVAKAKPAESDTVKKVTATVNKEKSADSLETINKESKSIKSEKVSDKNKKELYVKKVIIKDKEISDYIIKDILDSSEDDLELGDPENELEDDEELDDEDILALMSEGVVLDECSGSEDEN